MAYYSFHPPFYSSSTQFYSPSATIPAPLPSLTFSHGYTPPSPNPYTTSNPYCYGNAGSSGYYNTYKQQPTHPYSQHVGASQNSEMAISVFDGDEDAYGWVLCTEKHFKVRYTPEKAKVTEAVLALQGRALRWWLWWSHRHPEASWNTFTTALLWRFKPEWRPILPVQDEEEDPDSESLNSAEVHTLNDDYVADPVSTVVDEQKDMDPPLSLKQEYFRLPSCEPYHPHDEITSNSSHYSSLILTPASVLDCSEIVFSGTQPDSTVGFLDVNTDMAEHHSKERCFNDTENFAFRHNFPPLLPCGNESTNQGPPPPPPPPPPEPPDRGFPTMLPPPPAPPDCQRPPIERPSLSLAHKLLDRPPSPSDLHLSCTVQSGPSKFAMCVSTLQATSVGRVSSSGSRASTKASVLHTSSSFDLQRLLMGKSQPYTTSIICVKVLEAITASHVSVLHSRVSPKRHTTLSTLHDGDFQLFPTFLISNAQAVLFSQPFDFFYDMRSPPSESIIRWEHLQATLNRHLLPPYSRISQKKWPTSSNRPDRRYQLFPKVEIFVLPFNGPNAFSRTREVTAQTSLQCSSQTTTSLTHLMLQLANAYSFHAGSVSIISIQKMGEKGVTNWNINGMPTSPINGPPPSFSNGVC